MTSRASAHRTTESRLKSSSPYGLEGSQMNPLALRSPSPRARRTQPAPECGTPRRIPRRDDELVTLVDAARAGDTAAWDRLVRRFEGPIRGIARSHRLAPADVDEVVQSTWIALLEHFESIREPAALGGWLATVTRRNSLRRLQAHVNEQLTDEPDLGAC